MSVLCISSSYDNDILYRVSLVILFLLMINELYKVNFGVKHFIVKIIFLLTYNNEMFK